MTDASDPYGDKAWLDQQKRDRLNKGRDALLGAGDFDDFGGGGSGDDDAGDDDDDAGGGGDGDDAPARKYRGLRFQRLSAEGDIFYTTLGPVDDDCPVTPLGRDGKIFFFLTQKGQLVSYEDGKFGQAHLEALFADDLWWLMRMFPAFNQGGTLTGFKANFARMSLFAACARREVFDAREKVRGLGCWRGPDGELVQHLGSEVRVAGRKPSPPGMIDEFVYPGRPKVPEPIMDGGKASAEAMLADFQSFNWSRGSLDARLLLGWIGCAVLGAALDWRPAIFMTGDAGTGKSTLQDRIKRLLPRRLVSTVDASPAALRQIVNQDAMAVAFDEIEADMNNDQAVNVMKLARVAASGGEVHRGGKDHSASDFTLRGCFAFSAIVPPSMRPQDMQRMTFLRLQPLKKGNVLADFTDGALREHGQRLVGRMVAGWPRWKATLRAYELALQSTELGHNQRGAKQFGTLLAAADLMLFDEVPSEAVAQNLARGLARSELYEYETSDPTWLLIFRHVMGAQPQVWQSSGSPTVAEVVRDWLNAHSLPDEQVRLQKKLNRAGLALVKARNGHVFLAIPPRGQQMQAMFKESDFKQAGGDGAWTSALRNAPNYDPKARNGAGDGVVRADKVPRLGGVKCTQIWLGATFEVAGVTAPVFDLDPEKAERAMQVAEARAAGDLPSETPEDRQPGEDG